MIDLPITGVKVFSVVRFLLARVISLIIFISHCINNCLIPLIAGLSNDKTNISDISNDRESDSANYLQLSALTFLTIEKN